MTTLKGDQSKAKGQQSQRDGQCISTIDVLSSKIANLSNSLETITHGRQESELLCEKYFQDNGKHNFGEEETNFGLANSEIDYKRSKEELHKPSVIDVEHRKDLDTFAGTYSFKSPLQSSFTEFQKPQNDVRSLRQPFQKKIGTSESSQYLAKKPMLVELHSFPGFDDLELTPLPPPFTAIDVLFIVSDSQHDLGGKPSFKKEFLIFFHSKLSQAILQDAFWWFFCHKYKPISKSQELLFNRVAHNYTQLLVTWIGSRYQDAIFKRYPDLIAQAVYTTFCHAFQTSYHQFDEQFRDDLASLFHRWIVGTKPSPGSSRQWNFKDLEPTNMRKRETIHKDVAKTKKIDLDAKASEESLGIPKRTFSRRVNGLNQWRKISKSVIPKSSSQHVSIKENLLDPDKLIHQKNKATDLDNELLSKHVKQDTSETTIQQISSFNSISKKKYKKESCTAGQGPGFSKALFDIHGRSPLVEQYLRAHDLAKDSGMAVLIQRTEIKDLPHPFAPTYQDIIKESMTSARHLDAKFRKSLEISASERTKFDRKWSEIQNDFKKRTSIILSKPKEMKKISDLLRLEISRDHSDENDIGLAAALGYLDDSIL